MPDWNKRMEWDLAFARKSERTQKNYLADVRAFETYHGRSPEELGQPEVRVWVEHLLGRQLSPSRLRQHLAALVFLYRKTLGRPQAVSFFSWPNDPESLLDFLVKVDHISITRDANQTVRIGGDVP